MEKGGGERGEYNAFESFATYTNRKSETERRGKRERRGEGIYRRLSKFSASNFEHRHRLRVLRDVIRHERAVDAQPVGHAREIFFDFYHFLLHRILEAVDGLLVEPISDLVNNF